jgi:cation diffusion facilitator CzcD-associated flavoprotein CzcO
MMMSTTRNCVVSAAASSTSSAQRVCIIGAGAAGLAALQVFKNELQVTCFERSGTVGGAWAYAKEDNPMYDSLRTNLPKEIMAFSKNFPFRSDLPSFLHHTDVETYLTSFARDQDLNECIRLSTSVTCATFVYSMEEKKFVWKIKYQNASNNDDIDLTENYDALIVANGHFRAPNVPIIPGQHHFKGIISHSYDYKNPESFLQQEPTTAAKRVKTCLVVGGKSSGTVSQATRTVKQTHCKIQDIRHDMIMIDMRHIGVYCII